MATVQEVATWRSLLQKKGTKPIGFAIRSFNLSGVLACEGFALLGLGWWAMTAPQEVATWRSLLQYKNKEALIMALTDEQKQRFDENGYIIVRELLSDEEVHAVGQRADQIAVGEVVPEPGFGRQVEPAIQRKEVEAKSTLESIRKLGGLVRTDPVMHAHATNPKILDVLEDLIGPDIKLFGDQLFMKSSAHGSRKNYHQDSNSWKPYVPYSLVSCWAALDDATVENGCLWSSFRGATSGGCSTLNVRERSRRRRSRGRWKMRCRLN